MEWESSQMKGQIVAISIDKVQSFLTEVIHSHVQEKQTEEATLKDIMKSSWEISNEFIRRIEKLFPGSGENMLLSCSGVCIFKSMLPSEDLELKLNKMFIDYYHISCGQKLLRYVHFIDEDLNEIDAIHEAKKLLKSPKAFNHIIEKNQNELFRFSKINKENYNMPNNEDFSMFAESINSLYRNEAGDNENRFRIAIIKADLDGMGDMFKNISNFEEYQNVSLILNDSLSLTGLHEAAEENMPKGIKKWLFPFYIAGDDIFFAVSVSDLLNGIDVCRYLLKHINEKLETAGVSKKMYMSIGIEITYNRQPIRYYMDMVERQLKNAKAAGCPSILDDYRWMKISILNLTYIDVDYRKIKNDRNNLNCLKRKKQSNCNCSNCSKKRDIKNALQEVPIWGFLVGDIRRLCYIKAGNESKPSELGKTSFYYTLLERLTNKNVNQDDIKYINSVIYHLLPQHLNEQEKDLVELEMLLNASILHQLYRNGKDGEYINLNKKSKHRLETYLRLMLLFSDKRFQIIQKDDIEKPNSKNSEEMKNAKKYLLTKPLDYIYNNNLMKTNPELCAIFAIRPQGENRKTNYMKRLHIEKSMFIKLRNTDKITVEKAAELIELQNPTDEEQRKKLKCMDEKRMQEGKPPIHLYFNKKKFCELAEKTGAWTSDYVDSLMLLYECKNLALQYGRIYPTKKRGGNRNAKKH